jgi:hypothetical protein
MSAFTDMFGQLVRRQQASGGEFRLGAGVVGHTTRVVIVAIVVIGALALILEKNTAVAINGIIAVAAVAAYYLKGTWQFADKHPDAAALAGTSWPKAEPKAQPAQPSKVEPTPMHAEEPPVAAPPPSAQTNGNDPALPTEH